MSSPFPFGAGGVFNRRRNTSSPFSWSLSFGVSDMIDEFAYPTAESRMITFQIGAICVNWSQIDGDLGMILGKYMQAPTAHVDIATSIIDLSRKCELIKAFAFIAECRDTYLRLEKALNFLDNDLRPIRNRYVHDSYSFFTGDHKRSAFKTRVVTVQSFTKELLIRKVEPVSAGELASFNDDLDTCAMYLVGHLVTLMVDQEKAEPAAYASLTKVYNEAYDKLSDTIARYRSKTSAS